MRKWHEKAKIFIKRKDGRWEGRYIKGRDNFDKAKYGYVYAKNYKDARTKLNEAKANVDIFNSHKSSQYFSDWSELWLEHKSLSVKQSTYVRYKNSLDSHIKPKLGSLKINLINTERLQYFFNEKANSGRLDQSGGLSSKTLSEMLMIIKGIFKFAKSRGEIIQCDVEQIVIKKAYHEMRILSLDEERRLNAVLFYNQDIYKLGILLCLYTGIRIGELCALKWGNISFEERTLKIDKTMQRLQCDHQTKKTEIVISEPKSSCSIRSIPLPDFVIKELMKFRNNDNNYILSMDNKKFIEPRTMQNHFYKYISEAKIEKANFHCLRHTFATRCVEKDFEIKSLSVILGHSSVKITLDKYVHVTMQMKRNNMSKVKLAV